MKSLPAVSEFVTDPVAVEAKNIYPTPAVRSATSAAWMADGVDEIVEVDGVKVRRAGMNFRVQSKWVTDREESLTRKLDPNIIIVHVRRAFIRERQGLRHLDTTLGTNQAHGDLS